MGLRFSIRVVVIVRVSGVTAMLRVSVRVRLSLTVSFNVSVRLRFRDRSFTVRAIVRVRARVSVPEIHSNWLAWVGGSAFALWL